MRGMKREREANRKERIIGIALSVSIKKKKKKIFRISLRVEARIGFLRCSPSSEISDHHPLSFVICFCPWYGVYMNERPCLRKRRLGKGKGRGEGHVSILSSAISFQVSAGKEERRGRRGRRGVGRNEGVNSMLRNLIEYWINKANSDVGNSLNASDPLIKMSLRNVALFFEFESTRLLFFFF